MDRREFLKNLVSAAAAGMAFAACTDSSNAMALESGKAPASTALPAANKGKKKMKIVVLTGSPRRNGNTNYMAERFIAGATAAGHEVFKFNCAGSDVAGCLGCNHCGMDGPCIYDDDFSKLRPKLIAADLVAFVSPMYYFGFSAQLKLVIDRFYAINGKIKGAAKKAVFMMAYADTAKSEAEAMTAHYKTLIRYLGWQDAGLVIASGVWTAGSIKNTKYGEEAYKLGESVA